MNFDPHSPPFPHQGKDGLQTFCRSEQTSVHQGRTEYKVFAGLNRTFGAECYASGGDAYYKAIQAGEVEPYAFSGPPDECTSDGCQHDYWGRRCRWRRNDPQFPSCPRETREGLINLLKVNPTLGPKTVFSTSAYTVSQRPSAAMCLAVTDCWAYANFQATPAAKYIINPTVIPVVWHSR